MKRVALIEWNGDELKPRASQLRTLGYAVSARRLPPPQLIRSLAAFPPGAIVIDLTHSPSRGRDLGVLLRRRSGTRGVPLVFAGGKRQAVAQVRQLLPDATFAPWGRIAAALKRAIARSVLCPVVPGSAFAAYAGRPLVRKLGLRPGMEVALLHAPPDFAWTLGALPEGVRLRRGRPTGADLLIWFARDPGELQRRMANLAQGLQGSVMWIAWPKGGTAAASQLTQVLVRKAGLEAGLVDYKICSLDERWSALLFKRR